MASEPDRIRSDIDRTRSELAHHVQRLAERTSPRRVIQRRWESAKGNARAGAGSLSRRCVVVGERVRHAPRLVIRQTEERPWTAGLAAFGAGVLVAALVPATPAERTITRRLPGGRRGGRHHP